MAKSINVKRKKRGRPATGTDPLIGVRLPPKLIEAIDSWARREGVASRSEAIRRMIEHTLADRQPQKKRSTKSASKAREMAGQEVDRLTDRSLTDEERERRKRRLTKGPSEFRELRDDQSKQKP
jgi:metal-responsive CopG/Arc/MetJ family transcriptional regulator